MRFPVFLDANALYAASLTDTLLRLAEADVIRPHWSPDVLDELERNLVARIGVDLARRRRTTMEAAFPEAMVTGYDGIVAGMENDPKDRHVIDGLLAGDLETWDPERLRREHGAARQAVAIHGIDREFDVDELRVAQTTSTAAA